MPFTLIQPLVNNKCPGFFFRIPQETCAQENPTKHRQLFTRVSSGGVKFFFYTLSSLDFTSSIFSPTSISSSASATARVNHPPGLDGHKKKQYHIALDLLQIPSRWRVSPPTTALPDTHMSLRLPPPPTKASLPLTSNICCHRHHHCQWWPPIAAYLMSTILIYYDISVQIPIYLRFSPPSYLKPELDRPPGIRVGRGTPPIKFLHLLFFWGLTPYPPTTFTSQELSCYPLHQYHHQWTRTRR